jgi:excisionase family DNA binding protein
LRTVREEAVEIARELGNLPVNVDMEFLAYLRVLSRFGVFRYGPITIAVSPVEELFWREYEARRRSDLPAWDVVDRGLSSTTDEMHEFFSRAWGEGRRSGRRSVNELDYLLTFMAWETGIPRRVFSELGVTPERVRAFAAGEGAASTEPAAGPIERLYSPEEAAQYFGVRVETVRSWIRSGRLPASRLAGFKSLRIRASDLATVLDPIRTNGPGPGRADMEE